VYVAILSWLCIFICVYTHALVIRTRPVGRIWKQPFDLRLEELHWKENGRGAGKVAQVVKHLPRKHEAHYCQKKKKEKENWRRLS
jgi:hypothetical protein